MIDRELSLLNLLRCASLLTDWAAQDLVAISLEPRKQNLRKLVEAVAQLLEVRDSLLQRRPDLAPPAPAATAPDEAAFGPDKPMPQALRDYFELESAIEVLDGFAAGHNRELATIAAAALPELKARLEAFDLDKT